MTHSDTDIKSAIQNVLAGVRSDLGLSEIRARLSVHKDIEVQNRRISRLCEEMVKGGTLTARYTKNASWGFEVGHYALRAA